MPLQPDRPASFPGAGCGVDPHRSAYLINTGQPSITTRPAFLEVYLENGRLFYRQVADGAERQEGVLLYS